MGERRGWRSRLWLGRRAPEWPHTGHDAPAQRASTGVARPRHSSGVGAQRGCGAAAGEWRRSRRGEALAAGDKRQHQHQERALAAPDIASDGGLTDRPARVRPGHDAGCGRRAPGIDARADDAGAPPAATTCGDALAALQIASLHQLHQPLRLRFRRRWGGQHEARLGPARAADPP